MRLEYYPEEKLKQEVLGILGKHLDLSKHKVFFFGSRVTNKGTERSDIDIGVEGPKPLPISVLGSIKDEVDALPTLYSIDVVDFTGASDTFRQVAKEKVEYIN